MYYICKFRCGCHRLPIESGRWHKIQRDERTCIICNSNEIGDEYHYILVCNFFSSERKKLLPKYCQKNANTAKFNQLFSSTDIIV